jgi:hypothetical protein
MQIATKTKIKTARNIQARRFSRFFRSIIDLLKGITILPFSARLLGSNVGEYGNVIVTSGGILIQSYGTGCFFVALIILVMLAGLTGFIRVHGFSIRDFTLILFSFT